MTARPLGTGCLLGIVAFIVAFGVAVLLVTVALPALKGQRPADVMPTPTLPVVVVDPTPRPAVPPSATATPEPTDVLPMVTRVPTEVPRATETPTPVVLDAGPTPTTRPPVQRG